LPLIAGFLRHFMPPMPLLSVSADCHYVFHVSRQPMPLFEIFSIRQRQAFQPPPPPLPPAIDAASFRRQLS
jgi:hypothetical protein